MRGGLVIVKTGHACPLRIIEIIEAGHPVPDREGERGASEILKILESRQEKDLVISCVSGGGSALSPLPAQGLSLGHKQDVTTALLRAGADIYEINTVRKHLSRIKGGRGAKAAQPATLINLIISDVVGDDPSAIASGPFSPDTSTYQEAKAILEKYGLKDKIPFCAVEFVEKGCSGTAPETIRPGDPAFEKVYDLVISSNISGLKAARAKALELGYNSLIISSTITGDTGQAALFHCAIAREVRSSGNPLSPPACLLSGGETTVSVTGDGKGGRNQEFALVSLTDINNIKDCLILSAGTDGTDGPTDAAGAIVHTGSHKRSSKMGLDPDLYLKNNDSYNFFRTMDDLFITGPTGTNVMDIRVMLLA